MKIEWFLEEMDKSAREYLELRQQLKELPADSTLYASYETHLCQSLLDLKRESTKTLATLDGLFEA